jgi:hypothetical protein
MFLSADTQIAIGGVTKKVSGGVLSLGPAPSGNLNYSATVNGSPRQIRIGESGSFFPSVDTVYNQTDDFYGSTPSLSFNLVGTDAGKTLVLSASGSPFGDSISTTANIKILDIGFIVVSPSSGLETDSGGRTATFLVVLLKKPTANVYIHLSSSNTAEGKISKSDLTFTKNNYSHPQTVTITGQDDGIPSSDDVLYSINIDNAVSADPKYSGYHIGDVSVTNHKNQSITFSLDVAISSYAISLPPGLSFSSNVALYRDSPDDDPSFFGIARDLDGVREHITLNDDGFFTVDESGDFNYHITASLSPGLYFIDGLLGSVDDYSGFGSLQCSIDITIKKGSTTTYNFSTTYDQHGRNFSITDWQIDGSTGDVTLL